MPRSQTHQLVEFLSYHGVKSRTLDYGCSREGFCGVKSRTLGLFSPCHSISKPIVILRGKKSQGKVSEQKVEFKTSIKPCSHQPNCMKFLL